MQPGNVALLDHDPELHDIIEKEKNRQWKSLELIASEVSTPLVRRQCLLRRAICIFLASKTG